MKPFKNIFQLLCVLIGTVVGTGIASGKSVSDFFIMVRGNGIRGILLVSFLFVLCAWGVMAKIMKTPHTFHSFYQSIFGEKWSRVPESLSLIFLSFIFFTMIQDSGTLLHEIKGCSPYVGMTALAIPCFFVLSGSVRRLIGVSCITVPLIVLSLLFWSIARHSAPTDIFDAPVGVFSALRSSASMVRISWWFAAVFYASTLSLEISAVLLHLRPLLTSKRIVFTTALLSGGVLLLLLWIVFSTLVPRWHMIGQMQEPMLSLFSRLGWEPRLLYAFLIYLSSLTTAIACGFVVVENVSGRVLLQRRGVALLLCLLPLFFSLIHLSDFVRRGYIFLGLWGAWILLRVVLSEFCRISIYKE